MFKIQVFTPGYDKCHVNEQVSMSVDI